MSVALETSRLYLRPCQLDDLTVIHALWTNDCIRYFLFDDRVISLDETRTFIDDSLTNFDQYDYGIWLVYTRPDLCFIGFAGCLRSDDDSPSLIYGIHPDYCNRGYATEAMNSILNYISTLPFTHVVADVDEPNEASIQVLKKLGMKQTKRDIIHGRPLLYFEYGLKQNGDDAP
jgi:[ribosomal protein S5]-alanine N-acetyltransferase